MIFYAYSPDLTKRYAITHAVSITEQIKYNGVGKMTMVLQSESRTASLINNGYIVYDSKNNTTFEVVNKKINTNNMTVTINGVTANSLLDKRVILKKKYFHNAESDVYDLINENLRGLPNIETAPLKGLSNKIESEILDGQLLDRTTYLLGLAGYGSRVNIDDENKKLQFEIYQGKDLTYNEIMPKPKIMKDKHTLLLLHGENLADSSDYGVKITNNGVAASDAQSKFGGKSLYFGSSSNSLSFKALDFLNGDFTIDWWERMEMPEAGVRFSSGDITYDFSSSFIVGLYGNEIVGGSNYYEEWNSIKARNMISTIPQAWVHWAVVRKGNDIISYKNGKKHGQGVVVGKIAYNPSGDKMFIGADTSGIEGFAGYIDEFRISDVARWTADFAPPDKPYGSEEGGGGEPENNNLNSKIYSLERGTAKNLVISDDVSVFKTTAYISGLLLDGTRIIEVVGDNHAGGERYEKWVREVPQQEQDQTEEDFRKSLRTKARAELEKCLRRQNFSVEINPKESSSQSLGNIVTCVSVKYGVQFNARISEYKYSFDANGEKSSLVLGEPNLTKFDEVIINNG